jgi:hypothetical protein
MFVGLLEVELAVEAPVNVQLVAVKGDPVEVLVKLMQSPSQMVVEDAVKLATGGVVVDADNSISSTAKDGSVATPSPSFFHTNPILTFGLLFALAGSDAVNAVHFP